MHNAKTDANQATIVKELRKNGFTVQLLSAVGKGVPDLLVGKYHENYLIEVKDGESANLNKVQVKWHHEWQGQVIVIHDMDELEQFMKGVLWGVCK